MCSRDRLDCEVHDAELIAEIGITAELIIAASRSCRPLSVAAIDEVLGVVPAAADDRAVEPPTSVVTAVTSATAGLGTGLGPRLVEAPVTTRSTQPTPTSGRHGTGAAAAP